MKKLILKATALLISTSLLMCGCAANSQSTDSGDGFKIPSSTNNKEKNTYNRLVQNKTAQFILSNPLNSHI